MDWRGFINYINIKAGDTMNKNQIIALEQIDNAFEWVIGSYKNDIEDNKIAKMPSKEELLNDIYEQLMNWTHTEFSLHSTPIYRVRLAGKDFITSAIKDKLKSI
jgi:hypothetical protein